MAVVSGFHRDLRWSTVIAGAILVRDGLPWVASNTDMTVPTPDGPGPGNGALVSVVARFADREPVVAGKPKPPLFEETLRRVGGKRPLVVGDRLDTDIEGANATGYDSLLVMTGVTDLDHLVSARPELRPSYVAADLGGLGRPQAEPDGGRRDGPRRRVAAPSSGTGASRSTATATPTRGGRPWRRPAGDTWTRPVSLSPSKGSPPG